MNFPNLKKILTFENKQTLPLIKSNLTLHISFDFNTKRYLDIYTIFAFPGYFPFSFKWTFSQPKYITMSYIDSITFDKMGIENGS